MNRNPQGKCIIVNNFNFHDKAYNRPGAEYDEQTLEALFGSLSFDVQIHRNLDSCGMRGLARTIASEDHSKFDAFICIVMSHGGDHDTILGVDGRIVTVEEMTSEFNTVRCETLKEKPKVFIFQFCRKSLSESLLHENHFMDSIVGKLHVDSTFSKGTSAHEADFLLAFATTPGCYCYRYENHGSPFIPVSMKIFIFVFLLLLLLLLLYNYYCYYYYYYYY